MNVLFICSRNQWRSPTAERIWRDQPGWHVRSAGTSPQARRRVSAQDIEWADVIFVMETEHRRRLREDFADSLADTPLHVLHIPDDYQFMDPELVEELRRSVSTLLGLTT